MRKGAHAGFLNSVQWRGNQERRLPDFVGYSLVYDVIFRSDPSSSSKGRVVFCLRW